MYCARSAGQRTKTTGNIWVPVLPAVYGRAVLRSRRGGGRCLRYVPVVFDLATGKDTRRSIAAVTHADEHVADIQQIRVTRATWQLSTASAPRPGGSPQPAAAAKPS